MTFAQTIRAYRESVGLTQAELAHKLTVSSQTVNNWETGRVEPWPRKKEYLLELVASTARPGNRAVDTAPPCAQGRKPGTYMRKRQPHVCEEITGESAPDPGGKESVAHAKIDFRRPPPHG